MVLQKIVNSKQKIVNRKSIIFLIITIYYSLFTAPAYAQVNVGTPFNPPFQNLTDVGKIISVILANAFVIAGVLLLFLIIAAGIGLISNAGTDDRQKIAKWKAGITAGIIGFLIIFASYWIIQIIELITGIKIL